MSGSSNERETPSDPAGKAGSALSDVVLCGGALVFAIAFYRGLEGAPHSARLMSLWICAGLGLSGAVLLVKSLMARTGSGTWRLPDLRNPGRLESGLARQGAMFAAMVIYVAAVSFGGFVVPSLIFLALGALLCGDRPGPALVLAVLTCGIVLGVMHAAGFYFPLW